MCIFVFFSDRMLITTTRDQMHAYFRGVKKSIKSLYVDHSVTVDCSRDQAAVWRGADPP